MTLRLENDRLNIAELQQRDRATKPPKFDDNVGELIQMYDDDSLSATQQHLQRLGVGLKRNNKPVQANLLRFVIDRIAVAYDKPPCRWLTRDTERVPESEAEHREMIRVVDRAQLDLAWREVDRLRALTRQAAIRYYPLDIEQAVVARTFAAHHIWRWPDPVAADRIEADRAVALQLAKDTVEVWWRSPDDPQQWLMAWTDKTGKLLPDQPFGETGLVSPYGEVLPISLAYDNFPGGKPWLAPRVSRASWAASINLLSNELLELVTMSGHEETFLRTGREDAVPPDQVGPGQMGVISDQDTVERLESDPRIRECADSVEFLTRLFLTSENMSPDDLSKGLTPHTGAALRVRERGLASRREEQIPLSRRDERVAWNALRRVHNVHAPTWGVRQLDETLDMNVTLADMDVPVDQRELLDAASRKMALGLASTIDTIQVLEGVTREQAIARYKQVKQDAEDYPPLQPPTPEAEPGAFADVLNDVRAVNGAEPADSVADAVRGLSAADRRADRRAQSTPVDNARRETLAQRA